MHPSPTTTLDRPTTLLPRCAAALAAAVPDKPAGAKYRHQWLQSGERVEVGVLARGLQAQQVSVTIEAQRLRVATTSLDGESGSAAAAAGRSRQLCVPLQHPTEALPCTVTLLSSLSDRPSAFPPPMPACRHVRSCHVR